MISTTTLPIRRILVAAVWLVWAKRVRLFQALVLPILLILLLDAAIPLYFMLYPIEQDTYSTIMMWMIQLARLIPYALFILTCHRIFLLGDASVPRFGIWRWHYREVQFLGWLLTLYFIYYLALSPIFFVAWSTPAPTPEQNLIEGARIMLGPLMFVILLLAAYVLARLSMLVPAAALEHRPTIKKVWALTRGFGIQLFVLVVLLPWIFSLIAGLLPWISVYPVFSTIMHTVLWMIMLTIEVAMLSLSYRELMSIPKTSDSAAPGE